MRARARWPRWLRRKRKPVFEPIVKPFADPVPLGDEVVRHLFATLASTSPADRRASRWVMNLEWFKEVRKAADAMGCAAFLPVMHAGSVEHLLGLPVEVRDDGGVPHLEPYELNDGLVI